MFARPPFLAQLSPQQIELLRGFGIFGAFFAILVTLVIALLSLASASLGSWV
ncbi:MAG: hypothetical protein IT290_09430 [Deltaproteobacteria bacterium]|nr:hypothetical protein [Deltaproteobacteria bacterium]